VPLVAAIIEETAAAVGELHSHGIIHRDLKPSNILLDSDGHVHVSDLGVSLRRLGGADAHAGIAGTPPFMAPELFEGRPSFRSDIYALGVTLFELLTAKAPFDGNLEELRNKHLHEPFPAGLLVDRNVPSALIDVIERAMHKQPAFRYKSAPDLARAFIAAIGRPPDLCKARIELGLLLCLKSDDAGQGDEFRGSFVEGAISSTIARIADEKRLRRLALEPSLALPLPPLPQRTAGIDFHVTCIGCGYELRGLPNDGKCPECGVEIRKSLDPSRVVFAPRRWLQSMVRGHTLVLISLGLCLVMYLLNTAGIIWAVTQPRTALSNHTVHAANSWIYERPVRGGSAWNIHDAAFGAEALICLIPLTLGIWVMTRARENRKNSSRLTCRAYAILLLIFSLFLTVSSVSGWSMRGLIRVVGLSPEQLAQGMPVGAAEILSVLLVALALPLVGYLASVGRSVPEPSNQRRIRIAAIVILGLTTILSAVQQVLRPLIGWLATVDAGYLTSFLVIAKIIGVEGLIMSIYLSRRMFCGILAGRSGINRIGPVFQ
jgi:hypothetical protein